MNKEQALAIAKPYGLEWEVQTWHDMFVKEGSSDEEAWLEALLEWDL